MVACNLCARLNLGGTGARGRLTCITIQTGVQDISRLFLTDAGAVTVKDSVQRVVIPTTFDERFFSLTAFRAHTDLLEDPDGADVYSILWFRKVSENANEWTFIW